MKPRAREQGLLVEEVEGDTLVYDLDRHQAHCLGPVLAAVWRLCDGRRTPADIARRLRRPSGVDLDPEVVTVGLRRLSRARLIEGRALASANVSTRDRRALLKKAALLGGLALATITAPTAASAATCIQRAACEALNNNQCTGQPCCTPGAPAGTSCVKQGGGQFCRCR